MTAAGRVKYKNDRSCSNVVIFTGKSGDIIFKSCQPLSVAGRFPYSEYKFLDGVDP